MIDSTSKLGITVIAILSVLSGTRLLIDHFFAGNAVGSVIGKIVDFLSANVKH